MDELNSVGQVGPVERVVQVIVGFLVEGWKRLSRWFRMKNLWVRAKDRTVNLGKHPKMLNGSMYFLEGPCSEGELVCQSRLREGYG